MVISAFGLIVDKQQNPPKICLVKNRPDPRGKPGGLGMPGGGMELTDRTPRRAARREIRNETGITTVLEKFFEKSKFGEVIINHREALDVEIAIYTFFMKDTGEPLVPVVETDETNGLGWFTLAEILRMPSATDPDGRSKNPEGVYFSHRQRIVKALYKLKFDFNVLIPGLAELMIRSKIKFGEVGEDVYYLLLDILDENAAIKELGEFSPTKKSENESVECFPIEIPKAKEKKEEIEYVGGSINADTPENWRRWMERELAL